MPQAICCITQRSCIAKHPGGDAGAGLGGGSGNAATALWAANELTGRPASNADLLAWSGEIGSDISIFFSDGAAYCTGRQAPATMASAISAAIREPWHAKCLLNN